MIDQQSNHCKYCNSDNPCERFWIPFCFCSFYILPGRSRMSLCQCFLLQALLSLFVFSALICFFCNCRCWCLGRFCSLCRGWCLCCFPTSWCRCLGRFSYFGCVTLTSATASTLLQYPGVPSSILLLFFQIYPAFCSVNRSHPATSIYHFCILCDMKSLAISHRALPELLHILFQVLIKPETSPSASAFTS